MKLRDLWGLAVNEPMVEMLMKRTEISSRSMWFADSDREGEDDEREEDDYPYAIAERDMERTLLAWWWAAYFEGRSSRPR